MSVDILIKCLSTFGAMSGLNINVGKSCLYTAGIHGQELEDILALTNLPVGTMPFQYLGIPLAAEKLKVSSYDSFTNKISTYIGAWSTSSLSYVGRAEFVRAVLQGVECFWLSIFPIPATVTSKIISLCRRFLWGSKKSLVAWNQICLPKHEGGLGFRDIKSWNAALLSKTLCNIHSKKDCLWIKWINEVHLRGSDIWKYKVRKGDSPLLKRLLEIRDTVRGKLQTKDRLWYLQIDRKCPFCALTDESTQHLFFSCRFCREVWDHIRDWLAIRRSMSTLLSSLKWMKKEARGKSWPSRAKRIALATTVYYIWMERNKCIFEGIKPQVESIGFKPLLAHLFSFARSRVCPE
ncbi:uncharacterized protein LOC111380779 [Olea europaea var. sylvestris]|uniref:uncharacterized protein LOC111380779 n=1 Tax=Olea europaea var. sylvestris TaxID=158386 RepID=UPI000C1D0CF5|nr:uncharacterized protein LOC111380779 [Olea europaea var. sylvestris]